MSSSNTLTGLIPVIYEAMDVVAREQVGFIPAVTLDPSAEFAALNQPIRSHVAPPASLVSITPGAYAPDSGGQTIGYVDLTISKQYASPIQWTGDEQVSLGGQYANVFRDQVAQVLRAFDNQIENDIAVAALAACSRVVGAAGTTPFATANDLSAVAKVQQVLDDNGAPQSDRHLVLGSAAVAQLRGNQPLLLQVNTAGSSNLLRRGSITADPVLGLELHNSAQIQSRATVGTGASYVIDGAGNTAVGSTVLKLKTGTGTILVGDAITIGSYSYVVTSALTSTLVTIAAPGLRAAVADGNTVTVVAAFTGNVALQKAGFLLATRQPLMPAGGDAASDVTSVTSPITGVTYQVALYKAYRQIHIEIALAWGYKAIKPEFIVGLLG